MTKVERVARTAEGVQEGHNRDLTTSQVENERAHVLLPGVIRDAIAAQVARASFFDQFATPIEGVIVDDAADVERLCQGMVEATTEWDWAEVPPDLQEPLRVWVGQFRGWARGQR